MAANVCAGPLTAPPNGCHPASPGPRPAGETVHLLPGAGLVDRYPARARPGVGARFPAPLPQPGYSTRRTSTRAASVLSAPGTPLASEAAAGVHPGARERRVPELLPARGGD